MAQHFPQYPDVLLEADGDIDCDPPLAAEAPAIEHAHSFLGNTGGRVMFSDIEVSSDEELIEAGYPFFSNAEDPELAAESRRTFLNRIGLGSD